MINCCLFIANMKITALDECVMNRDIERLDLCHERSKVQLLGF